MFTLENLSDMKKESLVDNFQQLIKNRESVNNENNNLSKINDTYNKLVEKGLIKKRGYTLRGIEDAHLLRCKIK